MLCRDVGGSFGIKVHTYADEMATVALSKLLKRPVKFVADRLESFVTDIHARGTTVLLVEQKLTIALEVADRVVVMNCGRITGELAIEDCDEKRLGLLMAAQEERVAA